MALKCTWGLLHSTFPCHKISKWFFLLLFTFNHSNSKLKQLVSPAIGYLRKTVWTKRHLRVVLKSIFFILCCISSFKDLQPHFPVSHFSIFLYPVFLGKRQIVVTLKKNKIQSLNFGKHSSAWQDTVKQASLSKNNSCLRYFLLEHFKTPYMKYPLCNSKNPELTEFSQKLKSIKYFAWTIPPSLLRKSQMQGSFSLFTVKWVKYKPYLKQAYHYFKPHK